jgi:2-polyprenyl-3-methyl-5-hydroxy-6-metoxy-1,4-benzoquinol methylase
MAATDQANEQSRLQDLERWYFDQQLNFDKTLIGLHYRTIQPFLRGPRGLELGTGDGIMTRLLSPDFELLTSVDGSQTLLDSIPDAPNLSKVCSLFEAYQPTEAFNSVMMIHILEHVADPVDIMRRAASWARPDGVVIAGVPNGHSFHRLAAVEMGMLSDPCQLNERDHALGHRRVYTPATFRADLEAAGLEVIELGGVFFKSLTNRQIEEWYTPQMVEGFYLLGKKFPEHAAEIYAICRPAAG